MVKQEMLIQTYFAVNENVSIVTNNNEEISIWKNRMENAIHIRHKIHGGGHHSSERTRIPPVEVDAKHPHRGSSYRDNLILPPPD